MGGLIEWGLQKIYYHGVLAFMVVAGLSISFLFVNIDKNSFWGQFWIVFLTSIVISIFATLMAKGSSRKIKQRL